MSGVLCGNEFQVQGVRLVLQILEPSRGGGGSEREGFDFAVGLPAHDQRSDHPRQVDSLEPLARLRQIPFATSQNAQVCAPAVMALVRPAADIWLP